MLELKVLGHTDERRAKRDRLELLTALMEAPGFDPLYRSELITLPAQHPVWGWECVAKRCERVRMVSRSGLCQSHEREWRKAQEAGSSRAAFLAAAGPYRPENGRPRELCGICPDRPAARSGDVLLCKAHGARWARAGRPTGGSLEQWLSTEKPLPGFGECQADVCVDLAYSALGLCLPHHNRYFHAGSPGGARNPRSRLNDPDGPVEYFDLEEFRKWCGKEEPAYRIGHVNLRGLKPLIRAEIQWGMHHHAQIKRRSTWHPATFQRFIDQCREDDFASLMEYTEHGLGSGLTDQAKTYHSQLRMMLWEITTGLRCIYYSPADTKDLGYIETDHFGRRFTDAYSYFDLSNISQRWLRDLLWEHLADTLRSSQCPRSRSPFDNTRRACVVLSAFLEIDAPGAGHDPQLLRVEHAQRFVADQRHRQRHGLQSLGTVRNDGKPSFVTQEVLQATLNRSRRVMFWAMETGHADQIGLDRGFITVIPNHGGRITRARNPFTDEVARALADEANLRELARRDLNDGGLRDIWEAIVATGRRCSEIIDLKLDCIGRYRGLGLPMLWHDQTKVGNYNEGIRIPEYLYLRLDARREKTLTRFEHRHGRYPTPDERTRIALFPSRVRNPVEEESISYGHFNEHFKDWLCSLDLGGNVAHQARHTLATKLLAAGASLAHIRRYLGHVSERMAEHYAKVGHSDLDDLLNAVWVAGPGSVNPGELLTSSETPLTQHEAMALVLDLNKRGTPTEGGICTFQVVVDGGTCPWNLDCTNCDKFVLSGADLLYWRRKAEQWRSLAERAPSDEVADFLHAAFEPTARAIAGLEKALAGLGILDQALALDLRRPQDYFHRLWSLNFRANDLAALTDLGVDA